MLTKCIESICSNCFTDRINQFKVGFTIVLLNISKTSQHRQKKETGTCGLPVELTLYVSGQQHPGVGREHRGQHHATVGVLEARQHCAGHVTAQDAQVGEEVQTLLWHIQFHMGAPSALLQTKLMPAGPDNSSINTYTYTVQYIGTE